MRKKKKHAQLFGSQVPPDCSYCSHNVGGDRPICKWGLKMPGTGKCPRYRYDPLLRSPKVKPGLPGAGLDPEEFKL